MKNTMSKDIEKFLTPEDYKNLSKNIEKDYKIKKLFEELMKWPIDEKGDIIRFYYIDLLVKSPEIFNLEFLDRIVVGLKGIKAKGKHKEILREYIKYLERISETSRYKNMDWWILPSMDILDENKDIIRELDVMSIGYKNVTSKPIIYMDEVSVTDFTTKLGETKAKFGHIAKLINSRFPRRIKLEYYLNNKSIKLD